jgi:hypothetical protein
MEFLPTSEQQAWLINALGDLLRRERSQDPFCIEMSALMRRGPTNASTPQNAEGVP